MFRYFWHALTTAHNFVIAHILYGLVPITQKSQAKMDKNATNNDEEIKTSDQRTTWQHINKMHKPLDNEELDTVTVVTGCFAS